MSKSAKIALVTGASKGIGRGIAVGLAAAGWDVGVNYHQDRNGAQATASAIGDAGRRAWLLPADVGRADQVRAMFQQLGDQAGPLDLMVNNAGVQNFAPLLELKEDDWDRVIRTNLRGTFLCTQHAARLMRDRDGGVIINIGSGANKVPFPGLSAYCASKGGIETLTRVAAVELGRYGIRVNCVAPGCVEIERTRQEDADYACTWSRLTPAGRIGQVEDVADAVVFLAGEQATFITGHTLSVDGGLWVQGPWPYDSQNVVHRNASRKHDAVE